MTIHYQALTLEAAGSRLRLREHSLPELRPGQAAVRLKAAALNHRDLWIRKGQYAGLKFPVVLGSDGAGVVSHLGEGADSTWLGREVVINPALDWGPNPDAQGKDFRILGLPDEGTWAEYVIVPVENLYLKPKHLDFTEAAAIPLAGLTAYRALFTRAGLRARETLLLTGIGGGVAMFLLKFAVAAGARVFVTSGSPDKLERAKTLGAEGGYLYTDPDWAERLSAEVGFFDVVIDSTGGPSFSKLCDLTRAGGKLVFFGATAGNPPELLLRKIFWRQLNVLGTTMGSPEDFSAMLGFIEGKSLRPVIDKVVPWIAADDALDRMEAAGQFGKLVLKVQD